MTVRLCKFCSNHTAGMLAVLVRCHLHAASDFCPICGLNMAVCRVPGLVWRDVRCAEDVTAVLHEGWRARATAATALNAASSRSHALLCVKVRGVREGRPFTSLLYLVDLAGEQGNRESLALHTHTEQHTRRVWCRI